jgi:hypothetical protein
MALDKPDRDDPDQPDRVNLTQFSSVEDAVAKVGAAGDFREIAKHYLSIDGLDPTGRPVLFFQSIVNRFTSLHAAIAREMAMENPHAVFPLIRAYAEGAALLIYVTDRVSYIEALLDRPNEQRKNVPNRLKVGKLVAHAIKHAPGFKDAYDELTDFTHFGSTAMWSSFSPTSGGYAWRSAPHWRSEEQALIAAALTLEVSDASHTWLKDFGNRHLASSPE